MLLADLLIPLTMIILGRCFVKKPPKNPNHIYGYRTPMSMKNRETWDFAHRCAGRFWQKAGWVTLILTLPAALFSFGKDADTVGNWAAALCTLQCLPLVGVVFVTERELRRHFDKTGRRKASDPWEVDHG